MRVDFFFISLVVAQMYAGSWKAEARRRKDHGHKVIAKIARHVTYQMEANYALVLCEKNVLNTSMKKCMEKMKKGLCKSEADTKSCKTAFETIVKHKGKSKSKGKGKRKGKSERQVMDLIAKAMFARSGRGVDVNVLTAGLQENR